MNQNSKAPVCKLTWAIAAGCLGAFIWLGWASIKFGSIFDGMDHAWLRHVLPGSTWFTLTYGRIAFPVVGVVGVGALILV